MSSTQREDYSLFNSSCPRDLYSSISPLLPQVYIPLFDNFLYCLLVCIETFLTHSFYFGDIYVFGVLFVVFLRHYSLSFCPISVYLFLHVLISIPPKLCFSLDVFCCLPMNDVVFLPSLNYLSSLHDFHSIFVETSYYFWTYRSEVEEVQKWVQNRIVIKKGITGLNFTGRVSGPKIKGRDEIKRVTL